MLHILQVILGATILQIGVGNSSSCEEHQGTCQQQINDLSQTGSILLQHKTSTKAGDKHMHLQEVERDGSSSYGFVNFLGLDTPVQITEQAISHDNLNVPIDEYDRLVELEGKTTFRRANLPDHANVSNIHEVVGEDGVLVLTLDRTPERFDKTAKQLALGGIIGTSFPATDAGTATSEQLAQGCVKGLEDHYEGANKCWGYGCQYKSESAICESHRRALQAAKLRKKDWTLIMEDDMSLIDPQRWSEGFKKAWKYVPPESKIVRLSWCVIVPTGEEGMQVHADTGDFILAKWVGFHSTEYHPGLCTGGYMVHRDITDDLLSAFPCCAPVDGCYANWAREVNSNGNYKGMESMINMALKGSREYIESKTEDYWLGQYGVMFQERGARGVTSVKDQLTEKLT